MLFLQIPLIGAEGARLLRKASILERKSIIAHIIIVWAIISKIAYLKEINKIIMSIKCIYVHIERAEIEK